MKKIVAILVVLSGLFLLASCNKGPNISVTLSNATSNELEISIEVGNKKKVESGTVNVYLYTNYDETNQKLVKGLGAAKYQDTLTFTDLEPNTEYDVRVTCTYDEELGYEAFLGSFKTLEAVEVGIDNVDKFKAISSDLSKTSSYKLSGDLNFEGVEYEIIASEDEFKGVFDGDGHTIENVKITSGKNNIGLFGNVTGTIKNLVIKNMTIEVTCSTSTTVYMGAVAGQSSGVIENVTIENLTIVFTNDQARTTYNTAVGSIVGRQEAIKKIGTKESRVENCVVKQSNITVNAKSTTARIGGLIGLIDKEASQCETELKDLRVDATIKSNQRYGCIVGGAFGELGNCATVSDVYANTEINVENSYTANKYEQLVGGFAGFSAGAIVNHSIVDSLISVKTKATSPIIKVGSFAGKTKENLKISNSLIDATIAVGHLEEGKTLEKVETIYLANLIAHTDLELDPTVTNTYSNSTATLNGQAYTFGSNSEEVTPAAEEAEVIEFVNVDGYTLDDALVTTLGFDSSKWDIKDGKLVYKA